MLMQQVEFSQIWCGNLDSYSGQFLPFRDRIFALFSWRKSVHSSRESDTMRFRVWCHWFCELSEEMQAPRARCYKEGFLVGGVFFKARFSSTWIFIGKNQIRKIVITDMFGTHHKHVCCQGISSPLIEKSRQSRQDYVAFQLPVGYYPDDLFCLGWCMEEVCLDLLKWHWLYLSWCENDSLCLFVLQNWRMACTSGTPATLAISLCNSIAHPALPTMHLGYICYQLQSWVYFLTKWKAFLWFRLVPEKVQLHW